MGRSRKEKNLKDKTAPGACKKLQAGHLIDPPIKIDFFLGGPL